MTQVLINNIQVQFPYEPYQVQVDYMTKVIECLQQGVHGILESPTGTGKTLSLLCATLAWLEHKKAQQQLAFIQSSGTDAKQGMLNDLKTMLDGAAGSWNPAQNFLNPMIIYTSRTHSQLSQAVQELKRCSYKHVKSVVLGSRDQLCLHAEVSKAPNHTAKLYMCRAKIAHKTCPFGLNVEVVVQQNDYQNNSVMDIEDLVTLGKKHTCCPYYAARNLKSKADILFTPYNYIIDPKTRRAHGIELAGNVVIIDEAHNIESACEESMSFQLRSVDLAHCINEISQTIDMTKNFDKEFSSSDSGAPDFTLTDLTILKVMFCELEEHLDKAVAECPSSGCAKPGNYMIEIFAKVELTPQRSELVLDLLDKIILFHSASAATPWSSKGTGLQKFADILKILFSRALNGGRPVDINKEFSRKYQVYMQYETSTNKSNKSDPWAAVCANPSKKQSWKLDCWCFCPGLGMQEVVNQCVHSIILTSGTLSPLPPLVSELGISFPVQLENPHIITDDQVFVAIVANGPDGTILNSSYQNRSNQSYISSLGRTVSNFCRITPSGVLVFFPSYSVMKSNIGFWEDNGIWHSLSGIKPLFVEAQGKDAFQDCIEQFYAKINDPQTNGAALLGVCRGKVSEGLDFADKNARAVIITGLPFPPAMDPRVKMKMAYLNNLAKENKGLYGTDWYVLQASRAVNQAIGRVIRHKNDFGAILLCDNRFAQKNIQLHLSKWIQGRIKSFSSFGPAMKELSSFFRALEVTPRFSAPGPCFNSSKTVIPSSVKGAEHKGIANHKSWSESMPEDNIYDGYLKTSEQTNSSGSALPCSISKNQSIFSAIDEYAASSSSTVSGGNKAIANHDGKSGESNKTPANYNNAKRRKISIQFRGAEPTTVEGENKVSEREMWKDYLVQIKFALGASEKYAKFCASVKEYKSGKDVVKFSSEMKAVFEGILNKEKYLHIASLLVGNQSRNRFMELVSVLENETFS